MDASSYLQSLGIELRPAASAAVGRLSLAAEFEFDGHRGVIVRPKRGGVSSRYLEMLAAQGVDFVLVDGAVPLTLYGRSSDGALEPLRALPVASPSAFPSPEMLHVLVDLIQRAARRSNDSLDVGSRVLLSKLVDEETNGGLFTTNLSTDRSRSALRKFADAVVGLKLPATGAVAEAIATMVALLAGYRLSPQSDDEVAALVEFVARLADPKAWGLPHRLGFAVTGSWASGGRTVVASAVPGVQLLPLRAARHSQAVLPLSSIAENPLLRHLFSDTRFVDSDFLSWSPEQKAEAPDRIFVVPPFGRWITAADVLNASELTPRSGGKAPSRAPAETLYVEHAIRIARRGAVIVAVLPEGLLSSVGHAEFRNWLLERSQLLAVVSLPARSCFAGTAVRCSILYLKKIDPVPPDYPILMLEVEENDLDDPEARSRLGAVIGNAVAGEASR